MNNKNKIKMIMISTYFISMLTLCATTRFFAAWCEKYFVSTSISDFIKFIDYTKRFKTKSSIETPIYILFLLIFYAFCDLVFISLFFTTKIENHIFSFSFSVSQITFVCFIILFMVEVGVTDYYLITDIGIYYKYHIVAFFSKMIVIFFFFMTHYIFRFLKIFQILAVENENINLPHLINIEMRHFDHEYNKINNFLKKSKRDLIDEWNKNANNIKHTGKNANDIIKNIRKKIQENRSSRET